MQPGQGQSLQGCPTLEHTGHTSLDLYWPWKRSTMKESFLILCRCQASSATTCREKGLSTMLKTQACSRKRHPHLIRPPIRVNSLCVGLVLDAVEVLVQAIEQEGHELLSIMLGIASELAGLAGHDCLGGAQ